MKAKKPVEELTIAGTPLEYVGVDKETGGKKYRAKDAEIRIDKNAIVVKASRKAGEDTFEWRLETGDGKTFMLRADQLEPSTGNERRNKALMMAVLKKKGGQILIQGATQEDVRHFKKCNIEVDSQGWVTVEEALKAAEVAKGKELELCKCNFTKDRMERIGIFGNELVRASEFAKGVEEIIKQIRGERAEEVLRGKNLN